MFSFFITVFYVTTGNNKEFSIFYESLIEASSFFCYIKKIQRENKSLPENKSSEQTIHSCIIGLLFNILFEVEVC